MNENITLSLAKKLAEESQRLQHLEALEPGASRAYVDSMIPDHIEIRRTETASTSSLDTNSGTTDMRIVTALAANMTINQPSGTPYQGQRLLFRFKDNGTSRTLTWNAIFRAIGVDLPESTTASKIMYIGFIYNSTDTKWDCVAFTEEA